MNRLAAISMASGSSPQRSTISTIRLRSSARSRPTTEVNRATASSTGRMSRNTGLEPGSSASRRRLVAKTSAAGAVGRSGLIWPAVAASSSTTTARRVASRSAHWANSSSLSSGMVAAGTPSRRSRAVATAEGVSGRRLTMWAPRLRWAYPSGNRCRIRWAACSARVVLPTPAMPRIAETVTTPP